MSGLHSPQCGAVCLTETPHDKDMKSEKVLPVDIFVVDDEQVIGHTLGLILRQAGYGVNVFESANAAIKSLHAAPRLVISDQVMPGLTGCELAAVLNDAIPATKVLLFSSSLSHTDVEWQAVKAKSSEARLLAKPLYPLRLLSCVREMIGQPATA